MGLGERLVTSCARMWSYDVWSRGVDRGPGVVRVRGHERSRVSTYTTFVSSGRSRDVAVGTTGSRSWGRRRRDLGTCVLPAEAKAQGPPEEREPERLE